MTIDRSGVLAAYFETRWARARLRTREDIEQRQTSLWRQFAPVIAATPALSHLAGAPLSAFPITAPQEIRAHFERWNTLGLRRDAAQDAAADAERGGSGDLAPGVVAGFSTGTAGARGVFIANRRERAQYLGQSLAKLLPWDALFRPRRIMLCLRADSALYRDVRNAGPFQFHFVKLGTPLQALHLELMTLKPQILIAPAHILAGLARLGDRFPGLERVYYGAEPMSEPERVWIQEMIGRRPDPIYQATEGFLGASCSQGTLHLNEDTLLIERSSVPGADRFRPIVTDLRRTTQPIVRVQLDDLVEPIVTVCPCGSPLLAVCGIEGRMTDLWRWGEVVITPREVDAVVTRAIGAQADWRALASPEGVAIEVDDTLAPAATDALSRLLRERRVACPVTARSMTPMEGFKRRRIRWRDA